MNLKALVRSFALTFILAATVCALAQTQPKFVVGVEFIAPKAGCPVFIRHVTAGGPADKAGLKPGDAIVSIDNIPIVVPDDMRKIPSDKPKAVRMEVRPADGQHAYDVSRVPYDDMLEREGR